MVKGCMVSDGDKMKEKEVRIIKAATHVFSATGFYKAKISDIAVKAGIGKGTVYEYFDSKDDLFKRSLKYCMDEYLMEIEEIYKSPGNPLEKLRHIMMVNLEFLNNNINLIGLIHEVAGNGDFEVMKVVAETDRQASDIKKALIEEGIAAGHIRACNMDVLICMMDGGITQYFTRKTFRNFPEIHETLNDKICIDEIMNIIKV